jgi:uncharacterized protein YprB with RNaseH-like and TPR domain
MKNRISKKLALYANLPGKDSNPENQSLEKSHHTDNATTVSDFIEDKNQTYQKKSILLDWIPMTETSENRGILQCKTVLKMKQQYGGYKLDDFRPFCLSSIPKWIGQERDELILPEEILFFDLETTGLTGSGVFPFLAGLGYFKGDQVVCEQYFLRSPEAESLLLKHLDVFFKKYKFLITFNGSSFDLPLLNTRYIINLRSRIKIPSIHFDLYHILKKIYKGELPNHKLKSYENQLIELERQEDIPGQFIPQKYFDYIHYQSEERMGRVIEHNRMDIFSLAFLLLICNSQLADNRTISINIRGNLARILLRNKRIEEALILLREIESSVYFNKKAYTEYLLQGLLHKRLKNLSDAEKVFSDLGKYLSNSASIKSMKSIIELRKIKPIKTNILDLWEKFVLFILSATELAKIQEHHHKSFSDALLLISHPQQILREIFNNMDFIRNEILSHLDEKKEEQILRFLEREKENLKKREMRLRRKINRST